MLPEPPDDIELELIESKIDVDVRRLELRATDVVHP
jgi:hypothetical protein